jgi:TM2 domain-containing membrane protein YozV
MSMGVKPRRRKELCIINNRYGICKGYLAIIVIAIKTKWRPVTAPVCDKCHDGTYCRFCTEDPPKKKSTVLLLAVFLGWLGVHRFYMKFYFTGVIYLLSLGLFGVGWAIDVIRILLFSTVKKERTYSVGEDLKDALGEALIGGVSSDTSHILKYRLPWRDKFGRPLLPLGYKSLEEEEKL